MAGNRYQRFVVCCCYNEVSAVQIMVEALAGEDNAEALFLDLHIISFSLSEGS